MDKKNKIDHKELLLVARDRILGFFKDPSKPLALRVAVGLFSFFALLSLLSPSKKPAYNKNADPTPFPEGNANLVDTDQKTDQLKMLAKSTKERQSEEQIAKEREASLIGSNPSNQEFKLNAVDKVGPFNLYSEATPDPLLFSLLNNEEVMIADRKALIAASLKKSLETKILLDAKSYDAEFNIELAPINALYADDKEIWLGLIQGELLRYDKYGWKILNHAGEKIKGPVVAFSKFQEKIRIGAKGLWKWSDTTQDFIKVKSFGDKLITSFCTINAPPQAPSKANEQSSKLLAGGEGGIWVFNPSDDSWSKFWTAAEEDISVYSMLTKADGTILAGTENGIVVLSSSGVVVERMLPKEKITSFAIDQNNSLWVGTANAGLRYFNGKAWHRASQEQGLTNSIPHLLIDKQNRLWLSLNKKGVAISPVNDATAWIAQYEESAPDLNTPQTFSDMCEATAQLLEGVSLSGNIAIETIDGKQIVFANSQQICPKGQGFRRADGALLLKDSWNLTIYHSGQRQSLEIPQEFPADSVESMLLDSRERIWLGTKKDGIFMHEDKLWSKIGADEGLGENSITGFFESTNGTIWVSSAPKFSKETNKFSGGSVHAWTGNKWLHIGQGDGLAYWQALGLKPLKSGELMVHTAGGLSVIEINGRISNITKFNGPDPEYAHSVAIDNLNQTWIAHQYFGDGITWTNGKQIYRLDSESALFNNRISLIAFDRKNRVWLVASNGAVGVYPQSFFEERKVQIN